MILCAFCKKLDISKQLGKKRPNLLPSATWWQCEDDDNGDDSNETSDDNDDNADVSKDADDEEDLRKEVQPCSPCPNIPAYILYLPPSHSVRILSDSSCIYAAIRSICIGFNDGFVYIFTIHPEQVLYNAIYKNPGRR